MTTSKHRPKAPRRISPLGALRILDPEKWERAVRKAMVDADGRIPDAAEALGVSLRQMYRWLADERFAGLERAPVGEHRE